MEHYDIVVIGSGSGNTILDEDFADRRAAIIDSGAFGGTCLNVGCIPTKMFVLPADFASSPSEAVRVGVDLQFRGAWQLPSRSTPFKVSEDGAQDVGQGL